MPQTSRFSTLAPAGLAAALMCASLTGTVVSVAQEVPPAPQAPAAPAAPEGMDQLIAQVGEVAQRVSAKSEEVKVLEEELAKAEREAADSASRAEQAQKEADAASLAVVDQQARVNNLAQSRYRGDNTNPLVTALGASNPASAVERLGYLGALSRHAHTNLTTMSDTADAAQQKKDAAHEAARIAEEKKAALVEQRERVVAEREALEVQKRDIEREVDSLNEQQRQAWEQQFASPTRIDPQAIADASGSDAVAAAMSKIGSPYGWGATGPDTFDCSGLMLWAYQQMGKSIPRTSQAQIAGGTSVPIDQLQPGDIVGYYPGVTHVGMYIGDGQVVHASTYGVPVQVVPVDSMPIQGASRY